MLLITALSCSTGLVSELEAHTAPQVNTVIEVDFTLSEPATVCVAYTLDGEELLTPARRLSLGRQRLRVLGVPSATEVEWQLVAETDDDVEESGWDAIRTGNLPSRVPSFDATILVPDAIEDGWLLAAVLTTDALDSRVILDRQGRVVWYHLPEEGLSSPWVQAAPGEGVLANQFDANFCEDLGAVQLLDMSGEVQTTTLTEDGHHGFVQHDDGTLAWIAVDRREVPGFDMAVCGDRILELAPGDTEPVEVYSTWDTMAPDKDIVDNQPFYCDCIDWTHANMLSWESGQDRYLLSLSSLDTILEVARTTGEVTRSFGQLDDSYVFDDGTRPFNHQHGGHYTDDGNLLLTWTDEQRTVTQATEYALDATRGTIEAVWSYVPDSSLRAMALGEPHRLENGNTLVNFGSSGALHEVSADGELLWEATTDVGEFLGRSVVLDDLYALE
jgi:hypothetical protein